MARVHIERVINEDELPELASIFEKAMKDTDTFYEMLTRYGSQPVHEGLISALKTSIENSDQHAFKAVDTETGKVVGFTLWRVGYIELPKVDPFEPEANENPSTEQDPSNGFVIHEKARTSIWNAYIRNIRGKKHVFLSRIAVLPSYQKRGIATKLLQWGVDVADAEGIVAYLNARPAAIRLYENAGWKAVASTSFNFPNLDVAPVISMLRIPRPERKQMISQKDCSR